MAGNKLSPRQKMINMMYLVLTAMLALNVSMEVLNAFVRMEEGFQQSLQIVSSNNLKSYRDFQMAASKEPEKVGQWLDFATTVREETHKLSTFIDSVKISLIITSEGNKTKAIVDGHIVPNKIAKLDDTDTGTRELVGENRLTLNGKGYQLKKMIEDYRGSLVNLINETGKDTTLIATITGLLKTEDDKESQKISSVGSSLDWVQSLFYNTTLISDLALLSKFHLDILSSESAMLNHFYNKISADDFKFSNVKVVVRSTSDYVLEGSSYEAEIFLAAYNPDTKTTAIISGTPFSSSADGIVHYKTVGRTPGPVRIPARIDYTGPKGDPESENFYIEYNVIKPMATVSPTKMNVMYAALPNPLDISVGAGVSLEKVKAFVKGGPELQRNGNLFSYTPPIGMKSCEIEVKAEVGGEWKSMGSATFRVREVPKPTPSVDGISGKSSTKSEMVASQGIRAKMPADFDFDVKCNIKSFVVSVTGADGYLNTESSNNEYFTEKQRRLFNNLRSGSQVVITEIQAVGPGGSIMDLSDLVIKIK